MEVIYSAKSCEEEDSDEYNKPYQYNNYNNEIEENSSASNLSEEVNSYKNNNIETINNLSDNDFDDIPEQKKELEKIPSNAAVPFIIYENGKFIITNQSKLLLNQKKIKHIGIISLVGKYRTGKSFLLNRVILNNKAKSGFSVGPTFKPCTKGIWIWSEPIMIKNNNEEFPCFMIDTEGLGAYDEEVNHDSKIFLIAILISSLFIFNSFGTIDENAISSLSFVLNLSKTIKLKNSFKEDNKDELAQYFPCFLWLLRDFSLRLVDKNGKSITEKQYLESALENIKGGENNDVIMEKNRVRTLIRTYFPERDCFALVRPVEEEKNLQKLQYLPDDQLRVEFLEQAKNFRNKVFKKIKPKVFHGQLISGSMLLELVQSILDSINGGGIPVIENSWKYVMKNECVKKGKELIEMFVKELREHRDKNKNREDFYVNMKNDIFIISQKYINEFANNNLLDEETKKEYIEKLKIKINNELTRFNKENEKLFEEKFIKELNLLSNQFMENFTNSDIYEKNSYQFFQDFEIFREKAISSTPDFPQKNEMLFDKILLIIKKFINSKMMKIKVINEEKNYLKEENVQQEEKINELTKEINLIKEKNNEYLNKLSNDLMTEKKKNKKVEEKLSSILDNKTSDLESLQKEYNSRKNNYEQRLKEINDIKDKMKKELKLKEEQLLVMKMNNEKITSLYEQKSQFLEKEVGSWKNKYHNALIETKNKENDLNKENIKLKEQNKLLMRMEKKIEKNYLSENNKNKNNNSLNKIRNNSNNSNSNNSNNNTNENSKRNLNNLMSYVKTQLKGNNNTFNLENILKIKDVEAMQNKGSQSNGERIRNYKELSLKNSKSKYSADSKETKVRNIEEQLINLNQYKDKINSSKDFKCKFCLKSFSFPEYKEHFNICIKNPMNSNNNNIIINPNSFNNSNKRNINNDIKKSISNSNSNSNSNVNRKSSSGSRINNSNLINNENNNKKYKENRDTKKYIKINNENSTKKYIKINYDNINNIRIDTNNQNENITYKINNNINKNNFNNINIKINNQNININRNLININNIKKITNNIHLNNYIKNQKTHNINNFHGNIINNVNINNITNNNSIHKITNINHSHNSNNNISKNTRNNYSTITMSNFNPKKLKIKIVKGRIRKDKTGKPYLEYIIEINYLTKTWQVNKRFNQFTNLYKNLKLMSNQGGPQLPQSANIFSNIGTLFSGLSHENKIVQLEKFLKDISDIDRINTSTIYRNFFEIEQVFNEYKGSRNNNSNINNENHNKSIQNNLNDKIYGKNNSKKNSSNSCTYNENNNAGGYSSYKSENKYEKMEKDIPKGNKKIILHKVKGLNNDNFEPKTKTFKDIKNFKYQMKKINI